MGSAEIIGKMDSDEIYVEVIGLKNILNSYMIIRLIYGW